MKIHYFLLASLMLTTNTHATEQVIWDNAQGNAAHSGYIAQLTNPANYQVLWTTSIAHTDKPAITFTTSAIVTDKAAYFSISNFSDNQYQLSALNILTGEIKWNTTLDATPSTIKPMMLNNAIYVLYHARDNNGTTLTAFNPDNGDILETHHALNVEASNPVTTENTIYLCSMNNIASLNAMSAQINWNYQTDQQYVGMPALDAQYIYQRTLHGLSIIDKTTGNPFGSYYNDLAWNTPDFPVLDSLHRAVYFLSRSGSGLISLNAIDANTMQAKWVKPAVFSNIVVADDDIYTFTPDENKKYFQLTAINAKTGQVNWNWQPPVGDHIEPSVMSVATSDTIFVTGTHKTYAISRFTHQLVWQINTNGNMLLGNGVLLISSTDDNHQKLMITAVKLT